MKAEGSLAQHEIVIIKPCDIWRHLIPNWGLLSQVAAMRTGLSLCSPVARWGDSFHLRQVTANIRNMIHHLKYHIDI